MIAVNFDFVISNFVIFFLGSFIFSIILNTSFSLLKKGKIFLVIEATFMILTIALFIIFIFLNNYRCPMFFLAFFYFILFFTNFTVKMFDEIEINFINICGVYMAPSMVGYLLLVIVFFLLSLFIMIL